MTPAALTERLHTVEAIGRHLDALVARDPRLAAVRLVAGEVAPRITQPGFIGMARVICSQQLSVASARAIWTRFAAIPGATDAAGYLELEEAVVRAAGLSAGKYRSIRAVAEAVDGGTLDFAWVDTAEPAAAIAALTEIKGVGPWTAEIYLMFCAGHPDIFPAGDLALQKAVAHALGMAERPASNALVTIAEPWSPHRAAAALLFWRYFAAMREREGIAL
jgi:DNA-3-methyladenine glycosylase II